MVIRPGHESQSQLDGSAGCRVGDSEEECGAGTPARRGSVGGPGPASAPASLQESAIKVAPGLGSKRVSWDPSVWAANDEVSASAPHIGSFLHLNATAGPPKILCNRTHEAGLVLSCGSDAALTLGVSVHLRAVD